MRSNEGWLLQELPTIKTHWEDVKPRVVNSIWLIYRKSQFKLLWLGLALEFHACIKDEGSNLHIMIWLLWKLLKLWIFDLEGPILRQYFGHVFFYACQCATIDEEKTRGIGNVWIQFVSKDFQKFITWLEKSKNGQQEWLKACIYYSTQPCKLKTP